MNKVYIGTSGWQYLHWVGKFYPQNLPQKEWLVFYAKYFDTVEVNATFCSKDQLDEWAGKMKQWLKQDLDVYAYFNNDRLPSLLGPFPLGRED